MLDWLKKLFGGGKTEEQPVAGMGEAPVAPEAPAPEQPAAPEEEQN